MSRCGRSRRRGMGRNNICRDEVPDWTGLRESGIRAGGANVFCMLYVDVNRYAFITGPHDAAAELILLNGNVLRFQAI